jgi:hypothetical protein
MSKERKYETHYGEEDIAQIIADMFRQLQSPEGERFKVVHILKDVVMINITNKTFIINISYKDKLS